MTDDQSVTMSPDGDDDNVAETISAMTIVVCNSCKMPGDDPLAPRPGADLAAATVTAATGTGINVKQVGCLGNCKRGISAAILRDGCWSYVFGDLTPGSADDLIAGARLFAGSQDGFMPFRARPQSLKRGLIARIPSSDNLKDLS